MKPREAAKQFTDFINDGSTPKSLKIKSWFNQLDDKDKKVVFNNVSKAFESFQEEQKKQSEELKKRRKEVSDLRKKAKELGLKLVGG